MSESINVGTELFFQVGVGFEVAKFESTPQPFTKKRQLILVISGDGIAHWSDGVEGENDNFGGYVDHFKYILSLQHL